MEGTTGKDAQAEGTTKYAPSVKECNRRCWFRLGPGFLEFLDTLQCDQTSNWNIIDFQAQIYWYLMMEASTIC